MADEKAPVMIGEKIQACIASAPAMMAELMKEFIEKKDLNDRVKIRLRMKALLDLVAVDTKYPRNPAIDGAPGRPRNGGFMAAPLPVMGDNLGGEMARRLDDGLGGAIQPVPGAERIDNADVLG